MSTLVDFLRVRLDEDEQIARAAMDALAAHGRPGRWAPIGAAGDDVHAMSMAGVRPDVARMWQDPAARTSAAHIARHDPARVLAEVAAKRAILQRMKFVDDHGPARDNTRAMDMTVGASAALRDALKFLALVYADHPDYREDWRP